MRSNCLLCLKATGCGKTHTISGTQDDPGIIYLTMSELFQRIEDRQDDMICEVSLSFLEIYNEEVRDLLSESEVAPRGGLAMRDDTSNRVTVAGLTEKHPSNADEVKALVLQGNSRRTQSPTHANQTSSRSHAVLQVNVTQTPRTANTTELRTMATLSIIDLAGSERASATTNMGQRMVEGANINKSLLALGNCINALCESGPRSRHIPYRNSKLTRLLRFSLGGNCKTVMIVCLAPASNHYDDTQNTLKYANRAKDIKTKVSRNFINVDRHVGQYVEAINRLNDEVKQLKAKLAGKMGAEGDVQKRKKAEAKAELERVRADLASKADQTRKMLLEGAACEVCSYRVCDFFCNLSFSLSFSRPIWRQPNPDCNPFKVDSMSLIRNPNLLLSLPTSQLNKPFCEPSYPPTRGSCSPTVPFNVNFKSPVIAMLCSTPLFAQFLRDDQIDLMNSVRM